MGRGAQDTPQEPPSYLQSKLVLLALHFPRLRIVWSSSPHESVKILGDLKLNHDEPDEAAAILKGNSGEAALQASQVENAGAVEMLRAVPGVTGYNVRHVMAKVESVRALVELDAAGIKQVLGAKQGGIAFKFLHGRR